ncbi:MAG: hypothetical protein D3921_00985 [Candidatus Electrothrix sp. AW1]|nr:hypothetical protein [Candidatus Electrothrix gigas]
MNQLVSQFFPCKVLKVQRIRRKKWGDWSEIGLTMQLRIKLCKILQRSKARPTPQPRSKRTTRRM